MTTTTKTIIVFIVGVLLGIAGTGFYIHHCFTRAWVNSGNHKHAVDVLNSRLNLTADEKTKIEKVFDDNAPAMELIRVETNAKLKTIRDNTSAQIRLILNSDQEQKFDALRSEWDKKMNANDKGWHIPGLPQGNHSMSDSGTISSPGPDSVTPASK
jgi:hypothetical protein